MTGLRLSSRRPTEGDALIMRLLRLVCAIDARAMTRLQLVGELGVDLSAVLAQLDECIINAQLERDHLLHSNVVLEQQVIDAQLERDNLLRISAELTQQVAVTTAENLLLLKSLSRAEDS